MKPAANTSSEAPDIPAHWAPETRIRARLAYLYGEHRAEETLRRILRLTKTHQQLRTRVVHGHHWTHDDVVLITYGDSIQSATHPPLETLRRFLAEHLSDCFSMIHVLPFFPWSSDDGFSVTDFRAVKPELGTWKDIKALSEDFDLAIDAVLNHCSRENLWFFDYLSGDEPACNYFIEMDPASNLSMVTRPRATPVLSGVRTHEGMRHVWTTFSNDQVDLNYANPDVLIEFTDILLYYVRRGARMLRLDAVAYLWKEPGTSCIHLPQTHQVVRLFRDVLEMVEPAALIMTETNVPHAENLSYFGDGDEAHVIYQFSLPPLLLHALYAGDTRYLQAWARGLEAHPTPAKCTFLNFTASHDGIGMRPLEGLVPEEETARMLDAMRARGGYISTRTNQDGSVSPYELNISYFDAFRSAGDDTQWHIPMFMASQLVALSFRGIPAVYIHSLTATPNDILGVEQTGMTRSINRRKWDLGELQSGIGNPGTETGQVFALYRRILQLRRQQAALHPDGEQALYDLGEALFCFERTAPDHSQAILVMVNFTPRELAVDISSLPPDFAARTEILTTHPVLADGRQLFVPPYATYWFARQAERD